MSASALSYIVGEESLPASVGAVMNRFATLTFLHGHSPIQALQ